MKRSHIILGLALGAALLPPGPRTAHAQVVLGTQTQSFSNQSLELNGSPSLVLDLYNGGGTLTEVEFSVTASVTGSGTVTNTSGSNRTFTVSQLLAQFDLYVGSGGPTALTNLFNPNTGATFSPFTDANVSQIGSQTYTNIPGGETRSWGPFSKNGASSVSFTAPLDLAGFVGSGTYKFDPFTSLGTAISGGGGNIATNILDTGSVSITVTYRGVAAVPEPSTWLSGGLLSCLALGRAARRGRLRRVA